MFRSKAYQTAMNRQGFVVLPLLTEEAVQALRNLYEQHFNDSQIDGMFATHNRSNVELGKFLSNEIIRIVNPALEEKFKNYQTFVAHFVVKSAQLEDEFVLHQDWDIVDEKKYNSYHIWIPLNFTSQLNGGMFVLPKSHRFFRNSRSGSLGTPTVATTDLDDALLVDLNIPQGQALIWNDATFHGSRPNLSEDKRISVVVVAHEVNAKTEYKHYDSVKGLVNSYPLSPDSLLENLTSLEKGNIPKNWQPSSSHVYDQIDNHTINGHLLIQKSKEFHGEPITNLQIFKSDEHQLELEDKGFVVLPFLDESEVQSALDIFNNDSCYRDYINAPRYTSMEAESPSNKVEVYRKLKQLFTKRLNEYFDNYKIPIFQFFVKMANSDGEVGLHTDSSLILNPAIEPHLGLWVPLIDVDETNGSLKLLSGSHKWYNGVMASTFTWPFLPYLDQLEKEAVTMNLKAGCMVVFDNRIIHGSHFNQSENPRVAIAGRLTHEASLYYSFLNEQGGFVSVFEECDDIYLSPDFHGDRQSAHDGKKVGRMKQANVALEKMKMNKQHG